jgi:hypothetical protein
VVATTASTAAVIATFVVNNIQGRYLSFTS